MDATYYNGPDNRDVLGGEAEEAACRHCGAYPSEPCEPDCACGYCVNRRAREAAAAVLAEPR